MTNSSWLMNNVASKLNSVVPANDLKSLNKLKRKQQKKTFLNVFAFLFDFEIEKLSDRGLKAVRSDRNYSRRTWKKSPAIFLLGKFSTSRLFLMITGLKLLTVFWRTKNTRRDLRNFGEGHRGRLEKSFIEFNSENISKSFHILIWYKILFEVSLISLKVFIISCKNQPKRFAPSRAIITLILFVFIVNPGGMNRFFFLLQ